MKPFDFSRLENGKENKVRHFGGGDSVFSPSHGKSKNELNLKRNKMAKKMKAHHAENARIIAAKEKSNPRAYKNYLEESHRAAAEHRGGREN